MLGILVWTCVSALTVGLSGPAGSDAKAPEASVEAPAAGAPTSEPSAESPEPGVVAPATGAPTSEPSAESPEPGVVTPAGAPTSEPNAASTEPDAPAPNAGSRQPEPPAPPATDTPPPPAALPPPPTPIEVDPANYRMVLGGDIVIALGGAGFIALVAGLGIRSDAVALELPLL